MPNSTKCATGRFRGIVGGDGEQGRAVRVCLPSSGVALWGEISRAVACLRFAWGVGLGCGLCAHCGDFCWLWLVGLRSVGRGLVVGWASLRACLVASGGDRLGGCAGARSDARREGARTVASGEEGHAIPHPWVFFGHRGNGRVTPPLL
jgi:hypothetical protein